MACGQESSALSHEDFVRHSLLGNNDVLNAYATAEPTMGMTRNLNPSREPMFLVTNKAPTSDDYSKTAPTPDDSSKTAPTPEDVSKKGPTKSISKAPYNSEKSEMPENSEKPNKEMKRAPTIAPTKEPTITPTNMPTAEPTRMPTITPTNMPTAEPTRIPTITPTNWPTAEPTMMPTITPTGELLTTQPTSYLC